MRSLGTLLLEKEYSFLSDPKKLEKSIGEVLAEAALKHLVTNEHTIPNPGFLRDYEIAASVL